MGVSQRHGFLSGHRDGFKDALLRNFEFNHAAYSDEKAGVEKIVQRRLADDWPPSVRRGEHEHLFERGDAFTGAVQRHHA